MGVSFEEAAAPEGMRIYAIGDVHGRFDLLRRMHDAIEEEIARDRPGDWRIVHVGDYCDRGPDTRGVLDFLAQRADDEHVIALCGNHDEGMFNFLRKQGDWHSFTGHGGEDTARSYGVEADFSSDHAVEAARAALAAEVPQAHLDLLGSLPRSVSFGDFFFCHAGIRPGVPIGSQDPHDLIWIRDEFHRHREIYEKVIVHGHTPVDRAEISPNRVNIDTRAFHSGLLSGLAIEGRRKRLLEITERRS